MRSLRAPPRRLEGRRTGPAWDSIDPFSDQANRSRYRRKYNFGSPLPNLRKESTLGDLVSRFVAPAARGDTGGRIERRRLERMGRAMSEARTASATPGTSPTGKLSSANFR